MICSYLNKENIGFIELHPEQVFTFLTEAALNSCNETTNKKDTDSSESFAPAYLSPPIYSNSLTVSTLLKIIEFIKSLQAVPPKLILDFDKIAYVQKNLKREFDDLQDYLDTINSKLFFINFNIDLEKVKDKHLDYLKKFNIIGVNDTIELSQEEEEEAKSTQELNNLKNSIFKEKKHIRLISSFIPHDPPFLHESSSIYLNQYFDFKLFVTGEKVKDEHMFFKDSTFIYYCLYKIALKMITKNEYHNWEISPAHKVVIFCQTLNSSYIASFLADLLGTEIFLVDHLGPKTKLYSKKLYRNIKEHSSYLVVSDVLCLGTEVKNSKAIIEFSGAEYLGNVAFLRIETRIEKDIDFKDIEFFYRITHDYNPVKYSILNALNNRNG